MGLFDFRSPAQRRKDEEAYAAKIFPRGPESQQEIWDLRELAPRSAARWLMLTFVCGKEGVIRLREKNPSPTYEEERRAALKRMNPKRSKLTPHEASLVLELIFAHLAADSGEALEEAAQIKARIDGTSPLLLEVYSPKKDKKK